VRLLFFNNLAFMSDPQLINTSQGTTRYRQRDFIRTLNEAAMQHDGMLA